MKTIQRFRGAIKSFDANINSRLYTYGGLGTERRFTVELLKACDQLDDESLLVIGGFGDLYDYVEKAAKECPKDNVKFIGFVHPKDVIAYTSCAEVLFGMYHPKGRNPILTMPVKVLDAMNAGVPIIVNRELNACTLVKENEFGLCVPYDILAFLSIVKKLKANPKLRSQMGENAKLLGREKYSWDVMLKRLKKLYKELEGTFYPNF